MYIDLYTDDFRKMRVWSVMKMNYIEHYNDFRKDVEKKFKESCDRLSLLDKEQQDLLHYLELESCNGVMLVKIAKKLKEVRLSRREVKEELHMWQRLNNNLGQELMNLKKEKSTCKYKTNIIKELLEEKS